MKHHKVVIGFWIGLGLFVTVFSYRLGLGTLHSPGPGLMPFILGILLLVVSSYMLVVSFSEPRGKREFSTAEASPVNIPKLGLVLVSLLVCAFLLETLGYLIATFLLLVVLFPSAGSRDWRFILIASALAVCLTYFVFGSFGLRFPTGVLEMR